MNRFERIDFYKECKLPRPVLCGLVQKIKSPKGIRTVTTNLQGKEVYDYKLDVDLIEIYGYDKNIRMEAGLYWVMDIYRYDHNMIWNHYLIILDEEGEVYPVAEFLNCHDSQWMKKAIKPIKSYFAGEELPAIELTKCKVDKPLKKLVNS